MVVCYISKTFKVHQNPCRRAEWVKNTAVHDTSLNHIILFLVIYVQIVSDCCDTVTCQLIPEEVAIKFIYLEAVNIIILLIMYIYSLLV